MPAVHLICSSTASRVPSSIHSLSLLETQPLCPCGHTQQPLPNQITFPTQRSAADAQNRPMASPMTRLLSSANVRACLLRKGCTKLGHCMDVNGWKSPVELREVTGPQSCRVVARLLEEVKSAFSGCYRELMARRGMQRQQAGALTAPGLEVTLAIQVDPGEERLPPGTLFHIPDLGQFQTLSRKALYHACVKVAPD
ncbi:hypothetical protein SRHO_G00001940 [Serrasalmus rhombeus]